jgi:hypothetical protein
MKGNIKNLILLVVIGAVLVFVYFYFFQKDEPEENLVSNSLVTPTNVNVNTVNPSLPLDDEFAGQIVSTLSSIKTINLDTRIFESLAFKSLMDGTVVLTPDQNVGRLNPFAPIGVDRNANTTIPTSTTNTNPLNLINEADILDVANDLTLSESSLDNLE